jgi:hypothetical protein
VQQVEGNAGLRLRGRIELDRNGDHSEGNRDRCYRAGRHLDLRINVSEPVIVPKYALQFNSLS